MRCRGRQEKEEARDSGEYRDGEQAEVTKEQKMRTVGLMGVTDQSLYTYQSLRAHTQQVNRVLVS